VRAEVAVRDGHCRLMWTDAFGPCQGPSTWNHFNDSRRSHTRGLPPEQRHTTAGTMMNCRKHHAHIDENEIAVEEGPEGANGDLTFRGGEKFDHAVYQERR
jgi:hypothetical protein